MIALKKLYGEELLRLALMLSLLRVDPEHYLRLDEARLLAGGLVNGTDWSPEISGYYQRSRIHHPKSIDSMLLDYERGVFEEMMSLGRWSTGGRASREEFQAYLLSGVESVNGQAAATVIQNTASQDLYSHLPVVQLDDDEVEQCVTVKTEDDSSQDEDGACAIPQSYEQEVVIKTEDSDSEDDYPLYQAQAVSISDPPVIRNLSTFDGPLLEEDSGASDSFDVSRFFSNPPSKPPLKEVDLGYTKPVADSDDFFPFYLRDSDEDSIRDQNLADLLDFGETVETLENFKRQMEEFEEKHHPNENLDKYLLENTDLEKELDLDRMYCTKRERASTSFTSVGSSSGYSEDPCTSGASSCDESSVFKTADFEVDKDEGVFRATNLTQEDLDLIEVLWKQDVDLGFCLTASTPEPSDDKCPSADSLYNSEDQISLGSAFEEEDEIGKLKNDFKSKKEDTSKSKEEDKAEEVKPEPNKDDPWAKISYTIDAETGEYIIIGELPEGKKLDRLVENTLKRTNFDDPFSNLLDEEKSQEPQLKKRIVEEEQEDKTVTPEGNSKGPEVPEMLAPRYHPHHPHPHHHPHHHHHGGAPEHHALGPPPPQQQQQHHHFAAAYHHQNLMRSMSIEQRWQDLATLLALPTPAAPGSAPHPGPADPHHHHLYPQHHHHVNPSLGHCSQGSSPYVGPPYTPLPTEKPSIAATPDLYGPPNISTAVATSMNVSHEPPGCAASGGGPPPFYKAEHPPQEHQPDPMYYQNATNEFNGTSDGFLSQILNDDNFQLMDIAMNEGMYTMRMLESGDGGASGGGNLPPHLTQPPLPPHTMPNHHITMGSERIDASSDSAVSSMGSERVPSLSDGEWCDAGSDSAQDFHGKMRTCDNESRQPPLVAQKKHHMFGKRCLQDQTTLGRLRSDDHQMPDVKFEYEQPSAPISSYMPDVGHMAPEMKYSCTMEFNAGGVGIGMGTASGGLRHNHTYSLPRALPQPPHRPLARDKRGRKGPDTPGLSSCGSHSPLSRDEKRARALGIPLSVHDIINLPMDEFNERLSKHDLSETQLSLIRDIRRRGKNKVAAQNCRKRKLDQITSLADEVRDVRTRKQRLLRERNMLLEQRQRAKEHFAALYRHVFQHLRDADGNPLSSQQYSLQQAADGAVVVVPRSSASLLPDPRSPRNVKRNMSTNGTSDDDMDRNKLKQRKSFDQ